MQGNSVYKQMLVFFTHTHTHTCNFELDALLENIF